MSDDGMIELGRHGAFDIKLIVSRLKGIAKESGWPEVAVPVGVAVDLIVSLNDELARAKLHAAGLTNVSVAWQEKYAQALNAKCPHCHKRGLDQIEIERATDQPPERLGAGAETLARAFHEAYERLAPSFGYETRTETRDFDPTTKNGRLMVAVCDEIMRRALGTTDPASEGPK